LVSLPNIGLFDICLGAVYLFLIYFFAYRFQQYKINKNPEYHYFLVGLTAKIIGGVVFILISVYYYKKGDTFLYFQIAEELRVHLFSNFSETLNLIITPYHDLKLLNYHPLQQYNYYYERTTTWSFSKIVFFFNFISFGSYLVTSLLFSVISFLGLWMGYSTICKIYTKSLRLMVIPFFLIPTTLIWSSGILKDTILIGAIGVLIFSSTHLLIYEKQFVKNSILLIGCLLLFLLLKPILLFVFTPFLIIWITSYLIKKMATFHKRVILLTTVMIITLGLGYIIDNSLSKNRPKYQIGHLMHTLKVFHTQHPDYPIPKSKYALGEFNYSVSGVAIKIPEAINVAFFRPYLWEVYNIPSLLAAIESLLLFLFLIVVSIFSFKKNPFQILLNNKVIILMLLFSISYGGIVGLSTTNFGALTRHKIPAVFFFLLALIILFQNKGYQKNTPNKLPRGRAHEVLEQC